MIFTPMYKCGCDVKSRKRCLYYYCECCTLPNVLLVFVIRFPSSCMMGMYSSDGQVCRLVHAKE